LEILNNYLKLTLINPPKPHTFVDKPLESNIKVNLKALGKTLV
jgi:hypothetical protein